MSNFKVPFTKVLKIIPHENAHSLEIAQVYDFKIVVSKGSFTENEPCIYIPIDSIIQQSLEEILFPIGSKIKLNKSRIRQIKLRGVFSQGLLVKLDTVKDLINLDEFSLEEDLSEALKILKYEPPAYSQGIPGAIKKRNKAYENAFFHKYGGIDNAKWYTELFTEGEMISVTEKLHGTNARYGWVPYQANTWYKKLLQKLRLSPTHEFCYGSNNVQLQEKSGLKGLLSFKKYTGYYSENVYGKMVKQYDLPNKLGKGEVVYGEIVGPGIQKNYHYGIPEGEHRLVLFDLKLQTESSSEYVSPKFFQHWAKSRGFEIVPELYFGPYNKEKVKELTKGDSVYSRKQKVREGVVLKPEQETTCYMGRKLLKLISEDYLSDDTNTDNH